MFWMDFACWEGIPSDRDFYLNGESAPHHKACYLVARGYGVHGDYGNGSIMVKKEALSKIAPAPPSPIGGEQP